MKALFIVLTPISLDCETQYSIECCRGFEDMKDEIRSSLKASDIFVDILLNVLLLD